MIGQGHGLTLTNSNANPNTLKLCDRVFAVKRVFIDMSGKVK